ncbi:MAG: cyclic nucleotide-binding domain-containing protein [Acidobacteriia bacterium]|nr:cyclic nucleotide-binding domain-containing protein [Terriglobia bacterium]
MEPEIQEQVQTLLQPRQFATGEPICRRGDPASSLFVIEQGVAHVVVERPEGRRIIARLRRNDVVGEMSLISGEPHSATVEAILPTTVLELSRERFATMLAAHPPLFANLARIAVQRLARTDVQFATWHRRGEVVALVADMSATWQVAKVIEAAQSATPRASTCVDLTGKLPSSLRLQRDHCVEEVLGRLDNLLASHAFVFIVASSGQANLSALVEQADRVIVLGTEPACLNSAQLCRTAEVVLLQRNRSLTTRSLGGLKVIRTIDPESPDRDIAWLGRHLSRTKLGLALGAGGAKGYAHAAALHVLEAAGYAIDYVAGSSIGAIVGSWLALGKDAAGVEAAMRRAFSPETVAAMFKLSFGGMASSTDEVKRLWHETTDGLAFSDVVIPLVVMAVDLKLKQPAPITEGPLWEALMAASAVPGLYPPYQLGSQRLVDAIALVPVPTEAVRAAGADLVISVNLISRDTLPVWPAGTPVAAVSESRGSRVLDTLLEVMEMMQLDGSTRHAALADVVVTPRFGPGTWRDFQLADLFLAAGRAAMEEQIPALRTLANPQSLGLTYSGGLYASTSVHV